MKRVTDWVTYAEPVLGVALCGSYARGFADADSDVDLIVVSQDPKPFLSNHSRLDGFGSIVTVQQEDYGPVQSLRAVLDPELEVEFGLCGSSWAPPPIDDGPAAVISVEFKILYDPGDLICAAQQWIKENKRVN